VHLSQFRIFSAVIFFVLSYVAAAGSQTVDQLSPADLVKAVIRNEVNATKISEIRWNYRSEKEVAGKQETREVVETRFGSPARLIAVSDKPLGESQQRNETERISQLSHNTDDQRKLQLAHEKDVQQTNTFLGMIPSAFVFDYGPISNGLIKVIFRPNPSFRPPCIEGKILHEMAGEIWVDAKQRRLVSISGQLMNGVKFGGGLLGHLEKGGQFAVKRAEVAPMHWELVEIIVNMQGKALLFKTIAVQQKELRTNFQPVANDLTLADAAGLLLNQVFVAQR
jgi:hypothetical protein